MKIFKSSRIYLILFSLSILAGFSLLVIGSLIQIYFSQNLNILTQSISHLDTQQQTEFNQSGFSSNFYQSSDQASQQKLSKLELTANDHPSFFDQLFDSGAFYFLIGGLISLILALFFWFKFQRAVSRSNLHFLNHS